MDCLPPQPPHGLLAHVQPSVTVNADRDRTVSIALSWRERTDVLAAHYQALRPALDVAGEIVRLRSLLPSIETRHAAGLVSGETLASLRADYAAARYRARYLIRLLPDASDYLHCVLEQAEP